jgi:hypothetical protein
MNHNSGKYLLFKRNLSLILDTMIPGDSFMPCYTKAVKVENIIQRFYKNNILSDLKNKPINLYEKGNLDNYIDILGDYILENYFTSNLVIKALNSRKKSCLKNKKKENLTSLVKKVNLKKKYFRN